MTTPVRTRPRAASAAAAAHKPAATPSRATWLKRGAAVFETAETEAVKAEQRAELRKAGMGHVYRFRLKPGEEAEMIILDDSLDNIVALYEHNLQDSKGKWGVIETCIKEFSNCPVCDKYDESYYAMFLTVLDLRGYDRKLEGGGTEHVTHSRLLLPIKSGQIAKWRQIAEAAIAETGTLRGTYLVMKREKSGQSSNIGEPQLLNGARLFDITPEDQLVEDYGHDEVLGRDGKTVIKMANADITPFDYDILFPEPDVDDLMRRYGGAPGAGSAREVVKEFGEDAAAESPSGRRTRPRPTTAAASAAAPTRTRPSPTAAAAAPTRTRTRPAPAPAEEPVLEEEAPAEETGAEEPFEE